MHYMLLLILLLMPTAAQAAYTDATIASNRTNDSGAREVQVQFRGNAGESVVTRTYTVVSRGTAADAYAELRIWAGGVMNELDIQHTAGTAAAVQAGQKITPLSKPTVTAAGCSLWQVRYRLLRQFDGHGLTNSTVLSELTTLRNWVNANYTAGCIAEME